MNGGDRRSRFSLRALVLDGFPDSSARFGQAEADLLLLVAAGGHGGSYERTPPPDASAPKRRLSLFAVHAHAGDDVGGRGHGADHDRGLVGVVFFATSIVALVRARIIASRHLQLFRHPLGRQKRVRVYFSSLVVVWSILSIVVGVSFACFPISMILSHVVLEMFYGLGLRFQYEEFIATLIGSLPIAIFTFNVATKALWPAKRYVNFYDLQRERLMRPRQKFAICVDAQEQDDLPRWKLYRVVPDLDAEMEGCLRVADESGEDYLYPTGRFVVVEFSATVEKKLLAGN
jgi:hypothetical protein